MKPKRTLPRKASEVEAIEIERFCFVATLAGAAASGTMPVESPAGYGVNLVNDETGDVERLAFTDRPENRAALAVKKEFAGESPRLFGSCMLRLFALQTLFVDDRMRKYEELVSDAERVSVRREVLAAAATLPLREDMQFDADGFFAHVDLQLRKNSAETQPATYANQSEDKGGLVERRMLEIAVRTTSEGLIEIVQPGPIDEADSVVQVSPDQVATLAKWLDEAVEALVRKR